MSVQTENILASLQATDRAEDDFVAPASHPPNAPFLLAVPAGQSSKQVPTLKPTPLLRDQTRGQNKGQGRRQQGTRSRLGWGEPSPPFAPPRKERLSSVMCPPESVGWLRTVHHKLLSIGLAIAEKTSIEEVLGASHSVSFPGHLEYQEFFQAQFGLQPLMDNLHYTPIPTTPVYSY